MEISIRELLNQMEFVAKLFRLAADGKHKYQTPAQLLGELKSLKARVEKQLLAAHNQQEVLLDWLLMARIYDEVMSLSRVCSLCQDP